MRVSAQLTVQAIATWGRVVYSTYLFPRANASSTPIHTNTLWVEIPATHCHVAAIPDPQHRQVNQGHSRDSATQSLRRDEPRAIGIFSLTVTYFIMSLTSYNLILNKSNIEVCPTSSRALRSPSELASQLKFPIQQRVGSAEEKQWLSRNHTGL